MTNIGGAHPVDFNTMSPPSAGWIMGLGYMVKKCILKVVTTLDPASRRRLIEEVEFALRADVRNQVERWDTGQQEDALPVDVAYLGVMHFEVSKDKNLYTLSLLDCEGEEYRLIYDLAKGQLGLFDYWSHAIKLSANTRGRLRSALRPFAVQHMTQLVLNESANEKEKS